MPRVNRKRRSPSRPRKHRSPRRWGLADAEQPPTPKEIDEMIEHLVWSNRQLDINDPQAREIFEMNSDAIQRFKRELEAGKFTRAEARAFLMSILKNTTATKALGYGSTYYGKRRKRAPSRRRSAFQQQMGSIPENRLFSGLREDRDRLRSKFVEASSGDGKRSIT